MKKGSKLANLEIVTFVFDHKIWNQNQWTQT
jgi:hypothetical protein